MTVLVKTPASQRLHWSAVRIGAWYVSITYLLIGLKLFAAVLLSEDERGVQSTYEFLPKIVDGLILVVGAAGLVVAPSTRRKWKVVAVSLALLIMAVASQAISGRSFIEAFLSLGKLFAPFLLLSAFLLNPRFADANVVAQRSLVWLILVLSLSGLIFVEPSFRNGQEWLPAYFSGTHTSAYVAIFAIATAAIVPSKPWWRTSMLVPIVVLTFMVTIGWGVRTAMVGGGVAVAYLVLRKSPPSVRVFLFLIGCFLCALFFLLAVSSGLLSPDSLEELSSGRTTVWINRFGQIFSRAPVEWLLGTGIGSNVTYSEVWWWEVKDSHNDFLAVVYEQGIVGLTLVLGLISSVYRLRAPNIAWNAVWFMYISCSILSNGLMFRPTASCVFVLAALAACQFRKGKP